MAEIRPERVLSDLRALATFGAYKSGVHRPTLSPQDIAAREWFAGRLREAGHDASIDGIANILGRSPASGRKVLSGSHLESQNHAGWLDGALGCVYALEAARAVVEDPATRHLGVDVAVFCDEEGHFGSFLGSRSFIGALDDGDGAGAGGLDLGVVALDGGGDDDDVGVVEVLGAMAALDARADGLEVAGDLALALVGAGDLVAHVDEDLGDAAHPHAADADEVDPCVCLAEHRAPAGPLVHNTSAQDGRRHQGDHGDTAPSASPEFPRRKACLCSGA